MASNLRVDSIVPATGTNVSIGTATGGVNIPGVLTYEDVTNVDSVGVITARTDIHVGENIKHIGDTDTKIVFTDNQIDFHAHNSSRLYVNQYAVYVQTGHPLAFLATGGGATPHIKSGGTNNQDLLFTAGTGNPTRLHIKSGGEVGINTSTPQTELEVFSDTSSDITIHSARTSGTLGGIYFANGASAAGIVTAQYFVGTAGHHYWHCNGTERLKLENDGDLTITGVDNAELKLKCGASTGNNILAFLNSAGATKGRIYYDSDNNFMVFNTDGTSDERMRITNTGLVLVGTTTEGHSSADDLTINNSGHGGITIRTGTTSNGAIFFSDATSGAGEYDGYVQYNHHDTSPYMQLGVKQSTQLLIMDGKIGMGSTNPRRQLHIHEGAQPAETVGLMLTNFATG